MKSMHSSNGLISDEETCKISKNLQKGETWGGVGTIFGGSCTPSAAMLSSP